MDPHSKALYFLEIYLFIGYAGSSLLRSNQSPLANDLVNHDYGIKPP